MGERSGCLSTSLEITKMQIIKCAICGNNSKAKTLYKDNYEFSKIDRKSFSARRMPDGTHYRFLKCCECGLIFSSPIIDALKIKKFYEDSDFNYQTESEYLRKVYYKYFKKFINAKNKNVKILEIGCANGFFLDELYKNGYKNVNGVEPGEGSVNRAAENIRKEIKINIFDRKLFNKNTFDIILCFHTLDHVVDPNLFLKDVNLLLKKKGKVLFVVHDTDALSAKLFGQKSPIFDIEHIFLFNKNTLENIFKKNKFDKAMAFTIVNEYQLSYWVKLFPMPSIIKRLLLRSLAISRIGNLSVSLPAGNIGVVAQKQ
ncbi:MAG: methyltransferase type 11 [uncultured bacterium]|nr:MAG: methyltransferase type 11 [uncultured bacterium]HBB76070.1 hypothetical protein [Candidatus Levybacteria bacterium]